MKEGITQNFSLGFDIYIPWCMKTEFEIGRNISACEVKTSGICGPPIHTSEVLQETNNSRNSARCPTLQSLFQALILSSCILRRRTRTKESHLQRYKQIKRSNNLTHTWMTASGLWVLWCLSGYALTSNHFCVCGDEHGFCGLVEIK